MTQVEPRAASRPRTASLTWILNTLFGCSHKRVTFPITTRGAEPKRTYVTCLDCGQEFDYSWRDMRMTEGGL